MRSPRLAELPSPPIGRTGWPWTEETPPMPDALRGSEAWPRITIVTPSFEQGRFIEETIRSVLLQGYPDLEYIVVDGGSRDESVSILQRYAPWLASWISEPDGGQAHAINKGFVRATGGIVAWQNADDTYYPGALRAAGKAAATPRSADVFYGDKDYVAVDGAFLRPAPARPPTPENMIPWPCIHSEVTFFRQELFAEGRMLDESFRHYLDYEFLWHLVLSGKRFEHVPGIRATFRQHGAAKTSMQGAVAQAEGFEIYRRVYLDARTAPAARQKLRDAMRAECENDWGSYRFGLLHRHLRELVRTAGLSALTPKLMGLALASCLGTDFVRGAKGQYGRSKRNRAKQESL